MSVYYFILTIALLSFQPLTVTNNAMMHICHTIFLPGYFERYFKILPWSDIAKFPTSGQSYFAFPPAVVQSPYFLIALSTKYVDKLLDFCHLIGEKCISVWFLLILLINLSFNSSIYIKELIHSLLCKWQILFPSLSSFVEFFLVTRISFYVIKPISLFPSCFWILSH